MYLFKDYGLEQLKKLGAELGAEYKPNMDLHIYWLDPLLSKCGIYL